MNTEAILSWVMRHLKALVIGGIVLVLIITALSYFVSAFNTRVDKEQGLNGQYKDNQNELSACLTKITDSANLTNAQVEAMTEALVEAIKGRYDGRTASPGSMFSAIIEDYPNLQPFDDAFERAFVVIIGCREDYKNVQSKLIDMIRDYDAWRLKFPRRLLIGNPSDELRADDLRGEMALEQMRRLVLVKEALDAYEDGVLENENPWEELTPSS